jgi:hypothetical protein
MFFDLKTTEIYIPIDIIIAGIREGGLPKYKQITGIREGEKCLVHNMD